jgi:hypothetical protein
MSRILKLCQHVLKNSVNVERKFGTPNTALPYMNDITHKHKGGKSKEGVAFHKIVGSLGSLKIPEKSEPNFNVACNYSF